MDAPVTYIVIKNVIFTCKTVSLQFPFLTIFFLADLALSFLAFSVPCKFHSLPKSTIFLPFSLQIPFLAKWGYPSTCSGRLWQRLTAWKLAWKKYLYFWTIWIKFVADSNVSNYSDLMLVVFSLQQENMGLKSAVSGWSVHCMIVVICVMLSLLHSCCSLSLDTDRTKRSASTSQTSGMYAINITPAKKGRKYKLWLSAFIGLFVCSVVSNGFGWNLQGK